MGSVAGLSPGTTYYYRLDATNLADGHTNTGNCPADCGQFTTPGPGIDEQSASDVTSTSARLGATLDPDGEATSYHFEYDTSPYDTLAGHGSSVPAPEAPVGSGTGEVSVEQHLAGLTPGTVYHYRVVARSEIAPGEFEEFDGADETFTTQGAAGTSLPDGRHWEMVTPPEKHGAEILTLGEGIGGDGTVIQAAPDGQSFTYVADAPTVASPQGYTNLQQAFSVRGAGGWSSHDISLPHIGPTGVSVGPGYEYRFFSEDLSQAIVQPFGAFIPCHSPEGAPLPCLSQDATEQTAFLHDTTTGAYTPLVTGPPTGNDTAEPFKAFGISYDNPGYDHCPPNVICGPGFVAATPDAAHVVLSAGVPLTSTPAPAGGLYEWDGGSLSLVSVLPPSEGAGPAHGPVLDLGARNAVSADGSRVIWRVFGGGGGLYLRYNAMAAPSQVGGGRCLVAGDACTVRLDVVQPGAAGGGETAEPLFQDASTTGSRVFFTDTQRLTVDSGGRSGGSDESDLYECLIVTAPGGELECQLSDVTPRSVSGEAANVQGVLGTSEDGSYVYFVAAGVLENDGVPVPGAVHGACDSLESPEKRCNLYVRHGGVTSLVAVLSDEDRPDWGSVAPDLNGMTSRVSPDGGWLAFMSNRSLTGYHNRDLNSGKFDEEVYLYHAATRRLICASCNPSGARPVGVLDYGSPGQLVDPEGVWGGILGEVGGPEGHEHWLAANVPGWTPYMLGTSLYQSRYLSDTGRLFFNAHDPLVPGAVGGSWDVYEWEPPGVGGCSALASGFTAVSGGCVGLVSSPTDGEESAFLDANATGGRDGEGEGGGDVFFLTTAKLSPADFDTSPDVYDAHECSAQHPCFSVAAETPPPCDTEASCKPAPSPQPSIFGLPASATFSGPGNLTPAPPPPSKVTKKTVKCEKGKQLRRGKCVKVKTRRKSSSNHRRAK